MASNINGGAKGSVRISQREAKSFSRKRSLAACNVCRFRKIKCDNLRPKCSACQASEGHCVYDQRPDTSKFDPASILILDKLEQIQRDMTKDRRHDDIRFSSTHAAGDFQNARISLSEFYGWIKIPSSRISPDKILSWPILRDLREDVDLHHLNDLALAEPALSVPCLSTTSDIDLSQILPLMDCFLEYVHPKNPVLDIDLLQRWAQAIVNHGIAYDGTSCLVLISCALGCLAGPLSYESKSNERDCREQSLKTASQLYFKALERISMTTSNLLAAQCWFFSGVYHMYTFNVYQGWSHFSHASATLSSHLKYRALQVQPSFLALEAEEIHLYWSCWKSVCDLRAELPVPDSALSDLEIPIQFPTIPPADDFPPESLAERGRISEQQGLSVSREISWYYYQSDVILKRIEAQVLNEFYKSDYFEWGYPEVHRMIKVAESIESQIDGWFKTLSPSTRFNEWEEAPPNELIYNMQARVLELRAWLYRPFVYYAIHSKSHDVRGAEIESFVHKGIECSFHIIQSKPTRHRHHGTWFAARNVLSSALLIIAAIKANGVADYLIDWPDLISQSIKSLSHWASESPDLARGAELLQQLGSALLEYTTS